MRAWLAVCSVMVWLLGCSPELPSSTPLGSGPLAEPEPDDLGLALGDKRAQSTEADGGGDGAARAKRDAGVTAATSADAGNADDGEAATAGRADSGPADGDAAASAAFAGKYCGSDVTTLRCDGRPDLPSPDPDACIEVERKSDAEIEIVIIYTPTGGPFCTLKAKTAGNSATIEAGQTCPDPGVTGSLAGAVTSGTAKLDANRLSVDLEADLEGLVAENCLNGSLIYHFDGDRQ